MGIHFTKDEFADRKSKVVNELKKQGLDALLMFRQESMYWLTGYDTFGFVFFQSLILTVKGELILINEVITEFSVTKFLPNKSLHISTESSALSGSVTDPIKGLSDKVICAKSMSKCLLLTGTSVGSQTVPPEW